jgi:hypothetical protein
MKSAGGRAARPIAMSWIGFAVAVVVAAGLAAGCEPAGEGDLDLALYALESCSQPGDLPAPASARIVVRGPVPCAADPLKTCVDELAQARAEWGQTVEVGGIPEGRDREVTILAYASRDASGAPVGFARATGVTIRKGESTPVEAILARLGGVSCPATAAAGFRQRVFGTTTPVGGHRVVIAGGFTGVEGDRLVSPDDGIYLYDTKTGVLTRAATLARARGAHAAAFIPGAGAQGRVVFFGGAASLGWAAGEGFPLGVDAAATGGAFSDFELFDVASGALVGAECPDGCLACCTTDGKPVDSPQPGCDTVTCTECVRGSTRSMASGRILAKPAVMSDGFVIVTGGGDFPNHEVSAYRVAEVFDPAANCRTGGFQPAATAPRMESIRAGHSLTFIETTEAGRYRFLLWGGTKDAILSGGTYSIGETYTESSQQAKQISGVFRQVRISEEDRALAPNLYFHSMTALSGKRFLLAGGVRRAGDGALQAPNTDDLYLLTLSGTDTYTVEIERLANGLDPARWLHTGTSHDGRHVVLFGGFGGLGGPALADPRVYDTQAGGLVTLVGTSPLARAGHDGLVLSDDTVLLVGGLQQAGDLDGSQGLLEVYAPSILDLGTGN